MNQRQTVLHTDASDSESSSGFSLIELIIAVAVLAIALTGLVSTLYRSVQLDNSFKYRSIAMQAAKSMMSQIKAQPRNKGGDKIIQFIKDTTDSNRFAVEGLEDLKPTGTKKGEVVYKDMGGYLKIHVIVEWQDEVGEQEISMTSYLYTYDKS